jgi:predicted dehydrogenase
VSPLRIAIVGFGRMGSFHGRVLSGLPQIDVVAVADGRVEAQAAARAMLGDVVTVDSADGLAGVPGVEAWLIASSTPTHPSVVRTAITGGVHILCEKPLALDAHESDALGIEAAEAGLVLQVGFWRRFSPPWVTARRVLRSGAIGRPLLLRLSQWDADPPPPEFCDPAVSGGLAVDCGVHEFDLAEWLTGIEVMTVRGHHLPTVDESVADVGDIDNLLAVLELEGGVAATVDLSRNARYGDDVRTEILGSDGAVFVDLLPRGRTRLASRSGVTVVPGSEVNDATAAGVAAQAQAFAAAVRTGHGDYPGASASTRSLRVAMAVDKSIRTGRPVELGPSSR